MEVKNSVTAVLVGFLIAITVIDILFIIARYYVERKREREHMDETAVVAYNHDPDFKTYVDKYIESNNLTFEEAMDHKIVKLYLDYIKDRDE